MVSEIAREVVPAGTGGGEGRAGQCSRERPGDQPPGVRQGAAGGELRRAWRSGVVDLPIVTGE